MIKQQAVIKPSDIRPRLIDVINVLERTLLQSRHETSPAEAASQEAGDWSFTYLPSQGMFQDQARAVWMTAVRRQVPVAWLVQTHPALDTLSNFLCCHARVSPELIAEGRVSEEDFESLTRVCGLIASSPLRICDTKTTEDFLEATSSLARENQEVCVVCDWAFSDEEQEHARRLAERSPLTFLVAGY